MRKIVSLRLDTPTIAAARRRARDRKVKFTHYLEAAVLRDLDGGAQSAEALALVHILRALRGSRLELERRGIRHAAIFGSVARGEERPDSDVDVLIEIDRAIIRDLFDYGSACGAIEDAVGRPADVALSDRLRPEIAAEVARDRIDAF
jgi:uncharacterized protein